MATELERARIRKKETGKIERDREQRTRESRVRRRCTLRNEIIFPPECTQWNSTVTQPEKGDCTLNRLPAARCSRLLATSLLGVEESSGISAPVESATGSKIRLEEH